MTPKPIKILVVEDDADDFFIIETMLNSLKDRMDGHYYVAERSADYGEAKERLVQGDHAVCLLDYRMPGGNGLDFFKELKTQGVATPIIFLTGISDYAVDKEAMELGAADFLSKNKIDPELLERSIRYSMERTKNEKIAFQLASIVESYDAAIYLLNLEGTILSWNKGAERTYGFTEAEAIGQDAALLLPAENKNFFVDELKAIRRDWKVKNHESRHVRQDGTMIDVSVVMSPIGEQVQALSQVAIVARNITDRKKTEALVKKHEERIRQSEKLEAIGNLAAGVAHDFNNLLNVISGNSDLLLMDITADESREELEEIKKAVQRGSEMTRQLLIFSRKDVSQTTTVNLNKVVEEVSKMLKRMIREDVEIDLKISPALKLIKADSLHIQQILMNLAVNARDAMPDGGKLIIETKNMDLDENFEGRRTEIPPGSYVMLSVSDTGTGMDPEVQERLFEPFFTTKEPGKGTGLGLATVYGVVQKYGGYIWVYSEKGFGTTFRICFQAEKDAAAVQVDHKVEEKIASGTETILVVEDESSLRRVMVKTLQKSGYRVIEAENGEEGLARMWESHRDIRLLLTDSVMPKMSGKKLADEVKKLNPDLKVLFVSGYPRDVLSVQGVLDPSVQLLQKPFAGEDLLRKIREVLDDKVCEKNEEK